MAQSFIPFFWLLLVGFVVALIARRVKIPYAVSLVITGLAIGIPRLLPQAHLEPALLFTVLLPPLLFEAAINLKIDALVRDWRPIVLFSIVGTILSTFIVGHLTAWMLGVPLAAALVFGALISPTDPISVLSVFRRLGAGRRLTLIVEAESLFNDGVAVVLFAVLLSAMASGHLALEQTLWAFVRMVAGGVALGALIGALASRVHAGLNDHLVEITLTTIVAFGSYLAAEALHVSGVMAVVTAGLVIGNYGMQAAMSPGTRLAVTAFWEYAGFVVNSIVFLLVGIEVAYVDWRHKIGVAVSAVVIVLLSRAVIYPLSYLVNRFRGEIPIAWQHVLFWGSLRGALSMALVLGLRADFPERETVVAATFGVVLFTLLGQGLTIGPLLRRLGLVGGPLEEPKDLGRLASDIVACEAAIAELERLRAAEVHPNWAVELLTNDYRKKLGELEAAMGAVRPDHHLLQRSQADRARRAALLAERSAYHEAVREGWLDEADWREIADRLDAELIALRSED